MNALATPILQKAVALFQSGQFADALGAAEEALRAAPGHPEGLHLKALALGRLGRVDEALPVFDEAAASHPQRHAILANKGNALRAAGRLDEALIAYQASVEADPRFATGWTSLGAAYRETAAHEEAERALRRALALSPQNTSVMNNLGVVLANLQRPEDAIDMFSAALKLQPGMAAARINRGAEYRKLKRLDEALEDHRKAAVIAPAHPEAHYQLANSLRQAGDLAAAEQAYATALSHAPRREDIHRDLARMLWEMGESQRFLGYLDQTIISSSSAALMALKGELAFRAGQTEIAESAAKQTIATEPGNAAAYRILGRVRRSQHLYDEAIEALEIALKGAPSDFETLHELAETLMANGDFKLAVKLLERQAPPEHLQKHIALKAIAMRQSGDAAYRQYYDYDRFTKKIMIEPPNGFSDIHSFNEALAQAIAPLHATKVQPIDQTLYGGTQSPGRLWDEPHPAIQALKACLLEAAARYVAELPDDPAHPFLARKTANLECAGAWSVVLASGGGHVDHIHPEGWISATYYVSVPDEVTHSKNEGFLRLGASGVEGVALEAERWVKPEEGAAVFFPSYMWHGVEKFTASTPRITAPFDLAPALSPR